MGGPLVDNKTFEMGLLVDEKVLPVDSLVNQTAFTC